MIPLFSASLLLAAVGTLLAHQLTGTRAAPVLLMCSPNFQGQAVRIVSEATSAGWALPVNYTLGSTVTGSKAKTSKFRIEYAGQPDKDYIIR